MLIMQGHRHFDFIQDRLKLALYECKSWAVPYLLKLTESAQVDVSFSMSVFCTLYYIILLLYHII